MKQSFPLPRRILWAAEGDDEREGYLVKIEKGEKNGSRSVDSDEEDDTDALFGVLSNCNKLPTTTGTTYYSMPCISCRCLLLPTIEGIYLLSTIW